MTFKEIMAMPMSDTDSRTVGQYFCETLNEERKRTPKCTHYCENGLFLFRVPDHDITEDELFGLLDFEQMQYGIYGRIERIKNFKQLCKSWLTYAP